MADHVLDSGALQGLNRVLGATGGSPQTYVDSGNLQLSLDANDWVRRGRCWAGSDGIFSGRISNVHAGVGVITTTVDPYAATTPAAGYPNPVPDGFDVWVLASSVNGNQALSVTGSLALAIPSVHQAFGTPSASSHFLRAYVQAVTPGVALGAANYWRSIGDGLVGASHPVRVRRGVTIAWQTDAAAAGTFTATLLIGLFPAGLGQDAVGSG